MNEVARFEKSEIELGKMLGYGGYSEVYEIRRVRLNQASFDNESDVDDMVQARTRIARRAESGDIHGGGGRYAIKIATVREVPRWKAVEATNQLENEVRVLAALNNHPNILKLRAVVASLDDDPSYGIIVDRLVETLEDRVFLRWSDKERRFNNLINRMFFICEWNSSRRALFLAERLRVALGIANALAFLHNHNMVYRDLKPANVGFGADDKTRPILFDMGLCREMPSSSSGNEGVLSDERFDMSTGSDIGTIRYMSPEVRKGESYNQKVDVYSFTIVLWVILALEKPYEGFTPEMHRDHVVESGVRPPLHRSWPERLRHLMEKCWDNDPQERLSMERIKGVLKGVLADIVSA